MTLHKHSGKMGFDELKRDRVVVFQDDSGSSLFYYCSFKVSGR